MRRYTGVFVALLCAACPGGSSGDGPSSSTSFSGPFTGAYVETTTSQGSTGGGVVNCQNSYSVSGTVTMTTGLNGSVRSGSAKISGTETETGKSGDSTCPLKGNRTIDLTTPVTGSTSDVQFTWQSSVGTTFTTNNRATFAGTLAGGIVTGSLTWQRTGAGTSGTPGTSSAVSIQSNATVTMPVTLR